MMMQLRARFAVASCTPASFKACSYVPAAFYAARGCSQRRQIVVRAQQGSSPKVDEPSSSAASKAEELPPWVKRERERELQAQAPADLPWPLYLLFSGIIAIAAVGSIFEFANKNAIFGILQPDNPLWAPILGLFGITGIPTAGLLFFKGVNAANEAAERQDRIDGYLD